MLVATPSHPITSPETTLLSDLEVTLFLGTIPTLTDRQLLSLTLLAEMEVNRREADATDRRLAEDGAA